MQLIAIPTLNSLRTFYIISRSKPQLLLYPDATVQFMQHAASRSIW